ncbi:Myb-like, SWIRM and MPN domains 1 [Homalodisca vitripennis]|nr:Myb-like, SWIRM and MPN domains 1 [Homalodisca vitripennis]
MVTHGFVRNFMLKNMDIMATFLLNDILNLPEMSDRLKLTVVLHKLEMVYPNVHQLISFKTSLSTCSKDLFARQHYGTNYAANSTVARLQEAGNNLLLSIDLFHNCELFGRSWSRLAQYIGTKNSGQVKSYVKTMGVCGTSRISVATPSFGIDSIDYNVTELIHDMEIPASIEEVIAVVSTAQPTVIHPSTQKEVYTNASSTSHRKTKGRRKKNVGESNRSRVATTKPKDVVQVYNAEEIKDVLTGNKEKDTIILPNGEQVIRIRHGSSVSEGSDVDIDIDSDVDSYKEELSDGKKHLVKQELPPKEVDTKEEHLVKNEEITKVTEDNTKELFCETLYEVQNIYDGTVDVYVDNIGKEVSVVTDGFFDESEVARNKVERETQVFKGDLITPSGKVMTVIVDDMSNSYNFSPDCDIKPEQTLSKYTTSIQGRLDMVYQLPPPTKETTIEPHLVTQEEELIHPEFFSKTHQGFSRYLKIRNYIIDCWKNGKPNYVTKTSVRAGLKSCGDVNLISRIHTYLERKGYINFGCEQCHYNTSDTTRDQPDSGNGRTVNISVPRSTHSAEKRGESHRSRKKKLPYEDSCKIKKFSTRSVNNQEVKNMRLEGDLTWKACKRKIKYPPHDGGYTLIHTESGEVFVQHSPENNKINTRGIKPIKLIHCKSYSASNKAPYRIELEVSALVLVDVHSHLSPKCEVIGLLGGVYNIPSNVLSIITAVPCRTILSSNVHCDMCPVSQCESSELITSKGLSVVGWYHSHPNFDPSPSDTDVNTQSTLQSWFNETGKPFVGLIISPYVSVHNVSSYRQDIQYIQLHL